MEKKNNIKPDKLGNSTNVTIGKKTYSSVDVPKTKTDTGAAKKQEYKSSKINTEASQNKSTGESTTKTNKTIETQINRQSSITVTPKTIISKPIISNRMSKTISGIKGDIKSKVQNSLDAHNDSGASTVSMSINTASASVKVYKAANFVSPYAASGVQKTSQGVYTVGAKTVKVVNTIDSTITNIRYGIIPLDAKVLTRMALEKPAKRVYNAVVGMKTGIKTAVNDVRRYGVMISNGTLKAVTVTRGVLNGTMTLQVGKAALKGMRNATFKGIRLTGRTIGFALKTGAISTLKTGLWSVRGGVKGVIGVGNILSASEDMGAQALGLGIKSVHISSRVIRIAPRTVKTVVLAPVKTGQVVYRGGRAVFSGGKGLYNMVKMLRKFGLNDTVRYFRSQALKAFYSAGRSVVSLMMSGLRTLGMKVAVPLLVVIFAVVAILNGANTPLQAASAMFGGFFSIFSPDRSQHTDYDVHSYLQNAVVPLEQKVVADIMSIRNKSLVSNGGQYHYVRLFTDKNTNYVDVSEANINNAMYSTPEFVQLIEPLFKTIMFTEYSLEPTQAQVDSTLNDIWNTITKVSTKELPMEYCNPVHADCGFHLANIATCPNFTSGKHTSYTCSECCYRDTVVSGTEVITTEGCNGFYHCNGHKILGITLNVDGYYQLLTKYFTDPIDQLSNLPTRTQDQEEKLQSLKDNYELCLEYMKQVQHDYGSELGSTDISGVVFVNGSRPNNNAIIDLAKMQVGNIGGQPFWSWYGYDSRVEWCACFVSWCENSLGYIDNGKVPKFSYCPDGVNWFISHHQWATTGYQQPVAGDIIFFDWDLDGTANHVGLVIGNDGKKVYTVEGNSGDVCRINSYSLNSSVILGYGLPNY